MMAERQITWRLPEDAVLGLETYHAARRERRLLVPRCRACGERHWYPRSFCPFCHSTELDWPQAAGGGTVYSYSIMRRTEAPYAIAFVTLAEGPTMMTNIVECDLDAVHIGMEVRLAFRDGVDGEPYPVFRPAARQGA
jgi:uncharacterized OB-fold protein